MKNNGVFFAVLSGLFFGLLGYFGLSVINAKISVPTMLFWRFLISSLFILLLLSPQLANLKKLPIETAKVIVYGLFFYGSTSIFYFIAAQYIGSGLAMVIFFTYPALVMLINCLFYKHKLNGIYCLALVIIFIGMLCLVDSSKINFNFKGIAYSLLSAILYSLYIVSSKNSPVSPLISTFWVSLSSALLCLIAALLHHSFVVPEGLTVWVNILGIGILCTALPIVFLLKGLKHISSLKVSILSVLEPVFVVIFGILLLGEEINLLQGFGILILLSGALLSLLSHNFDKLGVEKSSLSKA